MQESLVPNESNQTAELIVADGRELPKLKSETLFERLTPSQIQEMLNENHSFKPSIFFEFLGYFLLNVILGPLTVLPLLLVKDGSILVRNLNIYRGITYWRPWVIYAIKIFCIVLTFTWSFDVNTNNNSKGNNSTETQNDLAQEILDQFDLVIYTEISLAVLYAAYYSSFTLSEINEIKHDEHHNSLEETHILEKLLKISSKTKDKFFHKRKLHLNFPEIDLDKFHFIYPADSKDQLPPELLYKEATEQDQITHYPLKNFLIIDGISYCKEVLRRVEYGHASFQKSLWYCQCISRLLVIFRVLYPIIMGIIKLFETDSFLTYPLQSSLFLFEQLGYAFLIWRFVIVYDILFVGILLYLQKLNILSILQNNITENVVEVNKDILKLDVIVPSNIQTWYNVRKLLSVSNQQMLTIVDINTSYFLLFVIFFLLILICMAFNLLSNIGFIFFLTNAFQTNSQLMAVSAQFVLVIIIILFVNIVIGMLINRYFNSDINILSGLLFKWKDMRFFPNEYTKIKNGQSSSDIKYKFDMYVKYMERIKEYFGTEDVTKEYTILIKQLYKETQNVIAELNFDLTNNPNTILGVTTQPSLLVKISGTISVVGISAINSILGTVNGTNTGGNGGNQPPANLTLFQVSIELNQLREYND